MNMEHYSITILFIPRKNQMHGQTGTESRKQRCIKLVLLSHKLVGAVAKRSCSCNF